MEYETKVRINRAIVPFDQDSGEFLQYYLYLTFDAGYDYVSLTPKCIYH